MSSPHYLHVETDNLPTAMVPVQQHVDESATGYETEIGAIGSVVDEIRCDEDRDILEKSNSEMELVTFLFAGFQGLARGDGRSIELLTASFIHAEEQATDEAAFDGTGRH
jgi:hypothetical protein